MKQNSILHFNLKKTPQKFKKNIQKNSFSPFFLDFNFFQLLLIYQKFFFTKLNCKFSKQNTAKNTVLHIFF